MRVLESLRNEVRSYDLRPRRVSEHVRAGAVGDGLVHDIPRFDLAPVATDDGVNMITHPLEQLIARGARPTEAAAKATTETSAPESPGRVRVRCGNGRGVGRGRRRRIRSGKHPVRRLAVPHERVSDDIHLVAHVEGHEGVRRAEIVAVRTLAWMAALPLQVVFR